MRWITPESFIELAKSMGSSLSKLTHGLERRGEARGPESLIFAQLPPSFNMTLPMWDWPHRISLFEIKEMRERA